MSDLPRLLFCCFDVVPGPSATSRRLSEYVKGLTGRFQVVVLSVKTPDHPHIEKFQGARLLRVPVGPGDLTARLEAFDRAVRRQLESEEYMLVHFFDPFGGLALAEKRGEYQYKLVYDACLFPSIELPFASPGPGAVSRQLIARARRQELFCLMSSDAVIVGNPLTRDWVSTLGVDRELVHVLHAPVDLAHYAQQPARRPDGSPMSVLHLGTLHGNHGLGLLLEALAQARHSAALRVTVVGPASPEWRERLLGQAQALGVAELVDLREPVAHEDLPAVLAAADVGALTLEDVERSRIVGAPLSRLGEYLAAGRPVLAADTPSSRHLVPEEAAVWYRPGDVGSLADALVRLANDVPLRLRLGEAARAATARWDGAKIRADLVALYTQVTGTSAPRALDEETFDPNGVTQLGKGRGEGGEDSRPRRPPPLAGGPEGTPATSKVIVARDAHRLSTDPAISRPDAGEGRGRLELPAVVGLLRQEVAPPPPPPVVLPPIPPLPSFGAEERTLDAAAPAGEGRRPDLAARPSPPPTSVADEELPELADGEVEELDLSVQRPEPGPAEREAPTATGAPGPAASGRTGRLPSGPRQAATQPPRLDPPGLELTEGPGPAPEEPSRAERLTLPPALAPGVELSEGPGDALPYAPVMPQGPAGYAMPPEVAAQAAAAVAAAHAAAAAATANAAAAAAAVAAVAAAAPRPAPTSSVIVAHPGPGPEAPSGAAAQPSVIVAPHASTPQGEGAPTVIVSPHAALPGEAVAPASSGAGLRTTGRRPPADHGASAQPPTADASSGAGSRTQPPTLHPSTGSGVGAQPPTLHPSTGSGVGAQPPVLHPSTGSGVGAQPPVLHPAAGAGTQLPTPRPSAGSGVNARPPTLPPSTGSGLGAQPPVLHPSTGSGVAAQPPVLHPSTGSGAQPPPARPSTGSGVGAQPPMLHPSTGSGAQPPPPRPSTGSGVSARSGPPASGAFPSPVPAAPPPSSSGSDLTRAGPPPLPAARPPGPARPPSASTPTPPPFPPASRVGLDPGRGPGPEAPRLPAAQEQPPFAIGPRIAPGVFAPADWRPPGSATPVPSAPPAPAGRTAGGEDAEEISDAEVQALEQEPEEEVVLGGDEVSPVDTDASPPASAINPWLAQLVHGYCPPGAHLFDRHVPPTTTPGREQIQPGPGPAASKDGGRPSS